MARGFSCGEDSRNTTNTWGKRCFSESILALAPWYRSSVMWEDENGWCVPLGMQTPVFHHMRRIGKLKIWTWSSRGLSLSDCPSISGCGPSPVWWPTVSEWRVENLAQKIKLESIPKVSFYIPLEWIKKTIPQNHSDRFPVSWSWDSCQVVLDKCTEF